MLHASKIHQPKHVFHTSNVDSPHAALFDRLQNLSNDISNRLCFRQSPVQWLIVFLMDDLPLFSGRTIVQGHDV